VKYVILIYSNPATWRSLPQAETDRIIGVHNDLISELTESGEFVGIYRLADGATAKTVDGVGGSGATPVVTDGPFGEAKEYLARLWELACESIDRALEIAKPLAQHAVIEVRPLMDAAGLEM
jgi:hypothetical protein